MNIASFCYSLHGKVANEFYSKREEYALKSIKHKCTNKTKHTQLSSLYPMLYLTRHLISSNLIFLVCKMGRRFFGKPVNIFPPKILSLERIQMICYCLNINRTLSFLNSHLLLISNDNNLRVLSSKGGCTIHIKRKIECHLT